LHEDFPCPNYAHYGGWPCQKDGSTPHHWTLTYLFPPIDVLEIPNRIHDGDCDLQDWEPEAAATGMVYRQVFCVGCAKQSRETFPILCLRNVLIWGILIKDSRTQSTVSGDGPGLAVLFAAHKQPVSSNFLYHSLIVLSEGGSFWYLVQKLLCTVIIDSVLASCKTKRFLFALKRHVFILLPPSGETDN
jgi:hypothetical protein